MLAMMEYIPIKTRVMKPPQDDLYAVLDESLTDIQAGDVVAVSSKVISIHEGNCVLFDADTKTELIKQEADIVISRDYWYSPLTVTRNAFIGAAGIDESNADGYLVPLPPDAFISAHDIYNYLRARFQIQDIGVVITDSHSTILRRGAMGLAIGWWGFHPTIDHVGEEDLFGREMRVEVANIVDGLAAGATVVMGEVAQCQPVVVIRGVPDVTFTDQNTQDELFVSLEEDTFRVLYQSHIPPNDT